MRLPSEIRFINEKLKASFQKLEYDNPLLFKMLNQAIGNIKENAFCGINLPKRLIPIEYSVKNLWKYDLPKGWRLLYSITNEEIEVVSIILEWLDHKNYERRFKY